MILIVFFFIINFIYRYIIILKYDENENFVLFIEKSWYMFKVRKIYFNF